MYQNDVVGSGEDLRSCETSWFAIVGAVETKNLDSYKIECNVQQTPIAINQS